MYTKKSKILPTNSEMKRIMLAFESHLQEEIMFAINSLTIYSCNTHYPFVLDNFNSLLENFTFYFDSILKNVSFLSNLGENLIELNVYDNFNFSVADIMSKNSFIKLKII